MIRFQRQCLEWILAFSANIDDKFGCMGVPSNNRNFWIQVQAQAMLIFLPQFRTNVNLFESGICLGPGELWNFLEARMLYDKCIENLLCSNPYTCYVTTQKLISIIRWKYVIQPWFEQTWVNLLRCIHEPNFIKICEAVWEKSKMCLTKIVN